MENQKRVTLSEEEINRYPAEVQELSLIHI